MFSSTRELSKEFMQAASAMGMNTHDYVYLLPWLQAEARGASPWIAADGGMMQTIKDNYANAIIVRLTQ
jgi:guanylate cyclase